MDHRSPLWDWFLNAGSLEGYTCKIFGFSLGDAPSAEFAEVENLLQQELLSVIQVSDLGQLFSIESN